MLKFGIKSQAIPTAWIPEAGVNQHLDEFCASITNHIALIPQRKIIYNDFSPVKTVGFFQD